MTSAPEKFSAGMAAVSRSFHTCALYARDRVREILDQGEGQISLASLVLILEEDEIGTRHALLEAGSRPIV